MAAKIGSADVSFRLGAATLAQVYLGSAQVWSAGRTLYFNNAEDNGAWADLANWWNDSAHTSPATSLPTSADSIVLTGYLDTYFGDPPTVANLTVESSYIEIPLIVTGIAIFNGVSYAQATITGNAVFNGSSFNDGLLVGNATFNNNAYNLGMVSGNATFNDNAFNDGVVTGTVTDNT